MSVIPPPPPPSLNEAIVHSKESWQRDLQALFDHAKDRFPDVVWELVGENDSANDEVEQVWGHKAIVYARAPPTFQQRYFQFRPPPVASPLPYWSPNGQSVLSLTGEPMSNYSPARSPSPYDTLRTQSPAPSTIGQILKLQTSIASSLFSNELEYLYTGKGLGEAFEFLFDTHEMRSEMDGEDLRIDKLRKDLVFMWRSRLYSDVRLNIEGYFKSSSVPNGELSSAEFSSHRFILASRSPYFRTELLGNFAPKTIEPGQPYTLTLPSPPFTPASLHFVIGYIYTGTLAFSNRTFDLDTAFNIMRSALYLSLTSLYNEVQARIVQEMTHGLFHAFIEFEEYERITAGKWGVGGCKCKVCARRVPRILEFATAEDVKNIYLERGARRALVGMFGEGWCTQEFTILPQKMRDFALKGVQKRSSTSNIIPLLIAAHNGLVKLDRLEAQPGIVEEWTPASREAIIAGLKTISDSLCSNIVQFLEEPEWLTVLEHDGARFEDIELVEWVMDAVRRGLNDKNGGIIYQALISGILIRPHPSEPGDTMLSGQSRIRALVEKAREDVIKWLRRRWMGVRQEHGFNDLESWSLKEISDEIEVPSEDLIAPNPVASGTTRTPIRSNVKPKPTSEDSSSISARKTSTPTPSVRERINSSARSVSTVSTVSTAGRKPPIPRVTSSSRPQSPATQRSVTPSKIRGHSTTPSPSVKSVKAPVVVMAKRNRGGAPSTVESSAGLSKTTAPLVIATATAKELATSNPLSRNVSSATSKSAASSNFKTAQSELSTSLGVPRLRRGSTSSNISAKSSTSVSTTSVLRKRKVSNASVVSSASTAAGQKSRTPATAKTPIESNTLARPKSAASIRSTTSTRTAKAGRTAQETPPPVPTKDPRVSNVRALAAQLEGKSQEKAPTSPAPSIKNNRSTLVSEVSDRASTIRALGPGKRSSRDTITAMNALSATGENKPPPKGAVLNVGIPCIVTSKRSRFRAFARYIGEVEGEAGTWVGVEVPVNDSWGSEKLDGRQWTDGSWGGIRYFDIHHGSEWDDGEERAARRRRLDQIHTMMSMNGSNISLKREGEQLAMERSKRLRSASPSVSDMSVTDTRALFVRPRQVLYVVDAVGSDL